MTTATLKRRRFHHLIAGGAALLAMPLRAQGRPEKSRVVVAVGGRSASYFLPLTIADQLGFFRAEGLEVDVSDFASGAAALQAVANGQADVVSGAYEHTISLQHRGFRYQAFAMQCRAPAMAMGISTRAMPNFKSVADLRGRKIGVSVLGSSTNMLAKLVLAQAGVATQDVSFIGVGTSANALTALRLGQVDAISNIDPAMTMLEQKGEVLIISDTRTLKGTQEIFGGPMPGACLFASAEFVQKNPGITQALANGIVHALKWLQTAGPGDIIKSVPEPYLMGDRGLYLASFNKGREAISVDGLLSDEGSRTALKAMMAFDSAIQTDKIALARTFTNEFARRAKDKFKV